LLVSSVFLVANAIPVPVDISELTTIHDRDVVEADLADAVRRDLDETGDLEKRVKTAKPKPAKAVAKPRPRPKAVAKPKPRPKAVAKPKPRPKAVARPKPRPKGVPKPKGVKGKPKGVPKPKGVKGPKPKGVPKPTGVKGKPKGVPKKPTTSCALKPGKKGARGYDDLEKRAPGTFTKSSAPPTITIKLGDKEFKLTKFNQQGDSGATYTVDGQAAFAKTPFSGDLTQEATLTQKVGLLIATGRDENCDNAIQAEWLVTKKVDGKRLSETRAFLTAKTEAAAGKLAGCTTIVAKAVDLTIAAVNEFHTKTGFNHNDFHPGNVFFDENVTKANLIDFGRAIEGPLPSPATLKAVVTGFFGPQKVLCLPEPESD